MAGSVKGRRRRLNPEKFERGKEKHVDFLNLFPSFIFICPPTRHL